MVETQSTQTRPDFIWLISAVPRDALPLRATLHHIPANSEQEARRKLARDHVCFFADRIRHEVRHA